VAVDIYTQTIHRTTQITTNVEECGPCPVFASFTLAFALQLREKHGKTSVMVRKSPSQVKKYLRLHIIQTPTDYKNPHTHTHTRTHTHYTNTHTYILIFGFICVSNVHHKSDIYLGHASIEITVKIAQTYFEL
jgi:hypothetical protein